MNKFPGFPARMEFTPIPNVFFSKLLPQIDDMNELKTVLYVMMTLYRKKGYPRFVTLGELLGNASLIRGLEGDSPEEALRTALERATDRGIFLRAAITKGETDESVYLLNDESGRQALAKIENGELALSGLKAIAKAEVDTGEPSDIFTLYEQNIGMLTPMIADELREIEKLYPAEWIKDAIREAVLHNKRNIRYVSRILENWSVEGRGDGTYRGDFKKRDPDKYIKGKYGHMVQR